MSLGCLWGVSALYEAGVDCWQTRALSCSLPPSPVFSPLASAACASTSAQKAQFLGGKKSVYIVTLHGQYICWKLSIYSDFTWQKAQLLNKSQYIVTLHGRYTRALTFKNLCQGCATVGFPSTFSPLARELRRKTRLASRSEKYFLQWLHTVNILVRALTYKSLYQVTSRKFGAALAPSSWLIPTDSRRHFCFLYF